MAEEIEFDMQAVTSTQLSQVGYNEAAKKLRVLFVNGATYEYDTVPKEVYEGLIEAPSAGSFFNGRVKGHFPFQKL